MKFTDLPAVAVPDILLPQKGIDLRKWCVIACDQYTSEPGYWDEVEKTVGDAPSTLRLILPEVKLNTDYKDKIDNELRLIAENIENYANTGIFGEALEGFIITDRSTPLHPSRKGIILAVDLEEYDFTPGNKSAVRATEGTVLSRIPPRVKIRANAGIEFPHVMLLYDDPSNKVIDHALESNPAILYDTDLMMNSGHITGRFIRSGSAAAKTLTEDLRSLISSDGLLFAVGDGNHSLAAAKAHWENVKKDLPLKDLESHPARFALAEAVNIHDSGLLFEPIHRVVFGIGKDEFIEKAKAYFGCDIINSKEGQSFVIIAQGEETPAFIANPPHELAVGSIQKFIDDTGLKCDYVHGEDSVRSLAGNGNLGILLPPISKTSFFRAIEAEGVYPRKTFSMGEAFEKRFYLEGRRISL